MDGAQADDALDLDPGHGDGRSGAGREPLLPGGHRLRLGPLKTVPLAAVRLWKRIEWFFPLRGRWLAYFLAGLLGVTGWAGSALRGNAFHFRVYSVTSPQRPYFWNPEPNPGLDCQGRMMFTGAGELARSLRMGNLVIEISQDWSGGTGPSVLRGPDCH